MDLSAAIRGESPSIRVGQLERLIACFATRSSPGIRGSLTFFVFDTMPKCVSSENVPASRRDWTEGLANGEKYALGRFAPKYQHRG